MATNPKLVKKWIQYLKDNRVVAQQADPSSGKLKYQRDVTVDDLTAFLELRTDYSEEQINNAISMVLAKKTIGNRDPALTNNPTKPTPGTNVSTWMHHGMTPGEPPERGVQPSTATNAPPPAKPKQIGNNQRKPTEIGHDPNSVSDVEYRDIPDEPNKPAKRKNPFSRFRKGNLKEDITDDRGEVFSEKDVETVFDILSGTTPEQKDLLPNVPDNTEKPNRQAEVDKIKEVIMDSMTHSQRLALWRALSNG